MLRNDAARNAEFQKLPYRRVPLCPGVWTFLKTTARALGKPRPSRVPEGQWKIAGGERSAATGRDNESEFALARAMEQWISI
jgi:hypothetical protein